MFYDSLIFLFRTFFFNSFSSSFMFSVIKIFPILIIFYVFPTCNINLFLIFCFSVFSFFICVKLFISLILLPSTSVAILFTIPALDTLFFFLFVLHSVFVFTPFSLLLSSFFYQFVSLYPTSLLLSTFFLCINLRVVRLPLSWQEQEDVKYVAPVSHYRYFKYFNSD